jgi:hypothetical protein
VTSSAEAGARGRRAWLAPFVGLTFICAWPAGNFLARNAAEISWLGWSAVFTIVAISTLLWLTALLVAFAPAALFPRWSIPRAATVAIAGVYLLFLHETAAEWLARSHAIVGVRSAGLYAVGMSATLLLFWRLSRHAPVRTACVIAAIVMPMLPVTQLVASRLMAPARRPPAGNDGVSAPANPPASRPRENVYYVVLDEYVASSTLARQFAFDNRPFERAMAELGYFAADSARANYTTTAASIQAALQMEYILDERSPRYVNRLEQFPFAFQLARAPLITRRLGAAGVDFLHVGNFNVPCKRRRAIECVSGDGTRESVRQVATVFLAPTKIPSLVATLSSPSGYDAISPLYRSLRSLRDRARPFFVLAHHLGPHAPYRDADCKAFLSDRPPGDSPDGGRAPDLTVAERRRQYVASVECVNRQVLALATRIRDLDPSAIVVFQADHGSDFRVDWTLPLAEWTDDAVNERTSILNLVKLPDRCRQWVRRTLSPVNTMRLVLACIEYRAPDYLPERSFVAAYERNADFGRVREVTDRLRAIAAAESLAPGRR